MKKYTDLESFSNWSKEEKDKFSVSVIKGLVLDAIKKANSGHPGGPMSCADFAYILYSDFLNFNPEDENWFNRDRFILSGGHMSMIQYSLLYLVGWLEMDDLKNFRQLNSKTPGHPEVEISGVECTTGPLGQGFGMGTGMAHAEAYLHELFKKDNKNSGTVIDHYTYVLASDGDLQEPISLGSASIAGHLGLKKLIIYYDANEAQISGNTNRSDTSNYSKIFDGFNWHVQEINGHDHNEISKALKSAQSSEKPSLIIGKTVMAKGAANVEGDHNTHGAPFSQDEIILTKKKLGLPSENFYCPNEVKEYFQRRFKALIENGNKWKEKLKVIENSNSSDLVDLVLKNKIPPMKYPEFKDGELIATRKAFGLTLDQFADSMPNLIGGSADLEPSNYTGNFAKTHQDFTSKNQLGRNIPFGVREFPMASMMNGISLHGGLIPFGGTFLVFSDYERPALRLAAIQKIRVLHEFTHDSFYVGEDGPTHQPIEHAMSLRSIPNFNVYRPADANETAVCFKLSLKDKTTPSALLLTRQGVPVIDHDFESLEYSVSKGGYIVKTCEGKPEIIFIATGSEVSLAIESAKLFPDRKTRVISMPCLELFEEQSKEYKEELLPERGCLKVSLEAGITQGWHKYTGPTGLNIGLDHYGSSAPGNVLAEKFGFTPSNVYEKINAHLKKLL